MENKIEIKIKRVDKSLPLPEYKTKGAAAFDFYAREDTIIPAQGWAKIPSNLIMQIPSDHVLIVSARSSLAKHYPGLFLANGIGVIDSDYSGPNDEILISTYNFSNQEITINRGERIAQGMVIKSPQHSLLEVEEMENSNRGGFGSTGLN